MIASRPILPAPAGTEPFAPGLEPKGREFELKFAIDEAGFKAAQASPLFGIPAPGPARRRLVSVYFDTDAGDLSRNAIALRIRKIRGGYLMGLKWIPTDRQGASERGELELKAPSPEPELQRFGPDVTASLSALIGDRPLRTAFVSKVWRSIRNVEIAGAKIEVAFDSGLLIAGDRCEPVREIEFELKSGDPVVFYRYASSALEAAPLKLAVLSKAERGAQLLTGEPPPLARAKTPEIEADTSMDDAIGVVLRDCLIQFTGNWAADATGDATEAIHQMRVSMRRLRAALGFFHRGFPCHEFDSFRAEAKRIAAAMGVARDWDVFVELVRSGPVAHFGESSGFAALLEASQRRADAGHASAAELLSQKSATRFVLTMEEFISRRGWRSAIEGDRLVELTNPVIDFAARCLERLDRKARRQGRHFGSLSPEERHLLRIALNKVRYASDFFGHLFRPRSIVRRYAQRAAALQDMLGVLNDAAVARKMIAQLDVSHDPGLAYAAGLIAGWSGRSGLGDELACKQAWRALLKAERYWRDRLDALEPREAARA